MPASSLTIPPFYIAEDGEVVGTLRRFSDWFRLTPAAVLTCLQERASDGVILEAGCGRRRLLVVAPHGLVALCQCRSREGDC